MVKMALGEKIDNDDEKKEVENLLETSDPNSNNYKLLSRQW